MFLYIKGCNLYDMKEAIITSDYSLSNLTALDLNTKNFIIDGRGFNSEQVVDQVWEY